jgi:hypothetical protein
LFVGLERDSIWIFQRVPVVDVDQMYKRGVQYGAGVLHSTGSSAKYAEFLINLV